MDTEILTEQGNADMKIMRTSVIENNDTQDRCRICLDISQRVKWFLFFWEKTQTDQKDDKKKK
jgi:hypothetical protein